MKPLIPHDPLDDLIAAALHGELTPEERTQFDARLRNDPAAQAAYQKAKVMHDLLEKTHQSAQPDPAFEQRMVSGVRRKLQHEQQRETAWESALVLWMGLKKFFGKRSAWKYATVCIILALIAGVALGPITSGIASRRAGIADPGKVPSLGDLPVVGRLFQLRMAGDSADKKDLRQVIEDQGINYVATAQKGITLSGYVDHSYTQAFAGKGQYTPNLIGGSNIAGNGGIVLGAGNLTVANSSTGALTTTASGGLVKAGAGTVVLSGQNTYTGGTTINGGSLGLGSATTGATMTFSGVAVNSGNTSSVAVADTTSRLISSGTISGQVATEEAAPTVIASTTPQGGTIRGNAFQTTPDVTFANAIPPAPPSTPAPAAKADLISMGTLHGVNQQWHEESDSLKEKLQSAQQKQQVRLGDEDEAEKLKSLKDVPSTTVAFNNPASTAALATDLFGVNGSAAEAPAIDTRKLIRNAQLDLEVKSYQTAIDQITSLTKAAGGYVDTSSSQKGGNGKLQGTVVVKVMPQTLDAFLLKLRDLGELQNQSVSTDDVTKAYFDTTARLENSRKMEIQLQELLKRNNGKVSELLQVERELGRVRGDIEQMQGQLKLYDFQVQFATVTMNMREKDLNQTAAYLLKEQDQFALFASDVEGTFQQARHTADDFKAQILAANLNHESGSNVSAELTVMVAPDQIEAFLAHLRGLGRVANFTRQTQRVAKDGGDTDQPADQTLTEKDKVQVGITIRSDDESRKQVALTVVTLAVDTALDQAKTAALANAGAEILSSSLNKTQQGQSTAQLSVRVPGKNYQALLDAYHALGRTASLSVQRNDNSGPGASGDDVPVIVSLALTDTDTPLQVTEMSVQATNVDGQAQQLKKDAAAAGVQVTGSNFQRDPNGMEIAQMTFRMPMAKYSSFVETLKKLGHVESLTVQRQDRPDQTRPDDSAPVEIGLRLHNQGDIVAENTGLWATLRQTFGEGAGALFGSVRVIGVLIAFIVPWVFALGLAAWIGRRIYIWKKK